MAARKAPFFPLHSRPLLLFGRSDIRTTAPSLSLSFTFPLTVCQLGDVWIGTGSKTFTLSLRSCCMFASAPVRSLEKRSRTWTINLPVSAQSRSNSFVHTFHIMQLFIFILFLFIEISGAMSIISESSLNVCERPVHDFLLFSSVFCLSIAY